MAALTPPSSGPRATDGRRKDLGAARASRGGGGELPLERRTLLLVWAAGWSALLVIMVGDVWMQHAMRGESFFARWHSAPRAVILVLIGAGLSAGVFASFGAWIDSTRPLGARLARYLPIGAAFWIAWSVISAALDVLVWPDGSVAWTAVLGEALAGGAFNALLLFAVMAVLYEAALNMRRVSRAETRAARYESELSRARTAALAAQLDPHFLFNTLHVASGLMRRDVAAARRVLADLRVLLRESLRREGRQMVRLEEEMRLVELYLRIQKARFGERLQVRLQVDPATAAVRVPPLLVQPLVENAIQHGIAQRREGGLVAVDVRRTNGHLSIVVENTAPADAEMPIPAAERIGLGGVRARLRTVFGEAARLEVRRGDPALVTAAVTLPTAGEAPETPAAATGREDGWRAGAAVEPEGAEDAALPGGAGGSPARPWSTRRWTAAGALAWLAVIVHYHVVLGFRRMAAGLPYYTSWRQLGPNTLLFLIGAALTPLLVAGLWRLRPHLRSIPAVVAAYAAAGLLYWSVWVLVVSVVLPLLFTGGMSLGQLFVMSAFISLTLYTGIALIVEAAWQLRVARRKAKEAAELRAELLAAETAALRSRVDPRLLFDALALASELMGEDVRAARNVLSDLSDLLRASLGRDGAPSASLEEELDHLRTLLGLLVGRGTGRAAVDVELDDAVRGRVVPRLALQPLGAALARAAEQAPGDALRVSIRGEPDGADRLRIRTRIEREAEGGGTLRVTLAEPDVSRLRGWLAAAYGFDPELAAAPAPNGAYDLSFRAPARAAAAVAPAGEPGRGHARS